MSAAAIAIDGSFYTPLMSGQPGVSNDSDVIRDLINKLDEHNARAHFKLNRSHANDNALQEVFGECAFDNWDGYGAQAINEVVFEEVRKIFDGLPSSIPVPEVAPEPSGALSLEWYKDPRNVFSISIAGNNSIVFAGLFGYDEVHGTTYYSETLPKIIVQNIKRVYP